MITSSCNPAALHWPTWRRASISSAPISLTEIAREINLIVRGWVNYYGRFYPAMLAKNSLRRIDEYLVRWAMRKYKRLKGHRKRAWEFLAGVFTRLGHLPLRPYQGVGMGDGCMA